MYKRQAEDTVTALLGGHEALASLAALRDGQIPVSYTHLFIWNLLMQLSLWVLSPVMLFVLGCGIYSEVRASWTDVFLLTLIEMGLFAAAVGAGGIMELMERLCERVEDVLTI